MGVPPGKRASGKGSRGEAAVDASVMPRAPPPEKEKTKGMW